MRNLLIIQQVTLQPNKLRDSARSRRSILDSAEHLFADRGHEATTVAEIAAAAGVSRGTPGYFFGSKEELYRAVLSRAFSETVDLIRSLGYGAGAFAEVTSEAIGRYLDFLVSRPTFVRLVVRECLDGGRFLEGLPEHLAAIKETMGALDTETGALRAQIDRRHLLLSGIALCWFPIIARPLTADLGFNPESTEFIEQRKHQVIELLLHGATTR
jgi:TetR/AcrR family transcriptional regulator